MRDPLFTFRYLIVYEDGWSSGDQIMDGIVIYDDEPWTLNAVRLVVNAIYTSMMQDRRIISVERVSEWGDPQANPMYLDMNP